MKKNGFSQEELFGLSIEKPVHADLEITMNCNQHCSFCFRSRDQLAPYEDCGVDKWKTAIDNLVQLGIEQVSLSGGETFLYKEISELAAYCKISGIKKIIACTNGTVDLNKVQIDNIDEVVFSVLHLGEKHDLIAGLAGSFDKLVSNIEYAIKLGKKVAVNTVVTENNIDDCKKIYQYFLKYQLLFHSFTLEINRERNIERQKELESILPKYLDFLETQSKDRRKLKHGMEYVFVNDSDYYKDIVPLPFCAGGKYKIVIDYRGDIFPCRYFQENEYLCGNIFTDKLGEVWKEGRGFKIFRNQVQQRNMPSKCQTCLKRQKCNGGCLAWRIKDGNKFGRDIRCELGNSFIRS